MENTAERMKEALLGNEVDLPDEPGSGRGRFTETSMLGRERAPRRSLSQNFEHCCSGIV
jgi:hypothetical protein